jgi:hypothetical protein
MLGFDGSALAAHLAAVRYPSAVCRFPCLTKGRRLEKA